MTTGIDRWGVLGLVWVLAGAGACGPEGDPDADPQTASESEGSGSGSTSGSGSGASVDPEAEPSQQCGLAADAASCAEASSYEVGCRWYETRAFTMDGSACEAVATSGLCVVSDRDTSLASEDGGDYDCVINDDYYCSAPSGDPQAVYVRSANAIAPGAFEILTTPGACEAGELPFDFRLCLDSDPDAPAACACAC